MGVRCVRWVSAMPAVLIRWLKRLLLRGWMLIGPWLLALAQRTGALLNRLPGGGRAWVSLISLGFVLAALRAQATQVWQLRPDPQGWLWLLLGVGVSLLSLLVAGLAWGVGLCWLGLRPRWEVLLGLYLRSNLAKYLPGGVWHLAQRLEALRGQSVPDAPLQGPPLGAGSALLATLLEPLLAAVAALALVSLGGWQGGLGLLTLLPLLVLWPRVLRPVLRRLEGQRARQLGLDPEAEELLAPVELPMGRSPWGPLLLQVLFVALRFAGFACCAAALDVQATADWTILLAGFALAWTAGLVVPGAPAGLGVFEAVLLLRLGGVLPEPVLLALVMSYRLQATVADGLAAALARLDHQFSTAPSLEK